MHRIEGDYYDDSKGANLFQDVEQNKTKIPAAWLNSIQEELCNLIVNLGGSIHTEGTDSSRTDLYDAFVSAGIGLPLVESITMTGDETFTYSGYGNQMIIMGIYDGIGGMHKLTHSGTFPDGYTVIVLNTSASMVVDLRDCIPDHIPAWDVTKGNAVEMVYDLTNDTWHIIES